MIVSFGQFWQKFNIIKINGHRQRVNHFKKYRHEINTQNVEMPFKVKDLDKFHNRNPNISVAISINHQYLN